MGGLSDPVKAPAHYAGDGVITCKHALKSMFTNANVTASIAYWWGCAFKYMWRWHLKNGLQDLEKCQECLDILIQEVKENGYMD